MITLGVDTSEAWGKLALCNGETCLGHQTATERFSHAEELFTLIDEVLTRNNVDKSAIELISINKGPGSFTGLRIGLAAAKGMCQSLGVGLVGVDGTVSYRRKVGQEARVCVIIKNRRDLVYARWFEQANPVGSTKVMSHNELIERLREEQVQTVVVGSGAVDLRNRLESLAKLEVAPDENNCPSAINIAQLGQQAYAENELYCLEPQYVELSITRN